MPQVLALCKVLNVSSLSELKLKINNDSGF